MSRLTVRSLFPMVATIAAAGFLTACPDNAAAPNELGTFTVTAPASVTIPQGGWGTIDIEVHGAGGFEGNVELTLEGHGGMTPVYSQLARPKVGQRIGLNAPRNSTPGEFEITVRGSSKGHPDHTVKVKVIIVSTVFTVRIDPPLPQIAYDGTFEVMATALGGVGEIVTGLPVKWSYFTPDIVDIAPRGEEATLTGVGEGQTFVFAEIAGVKGSSLVSVGKAPVATVAITAMSQLVNVGATLSLTATPKNSRGKELSLRTVTWSSSNEAIATVSSSGVVTGIKSGTVTIKAESEGKIGMITITVGEPVASITIEPSSLRISQNATYPFRAVVTGTAGTVLTDRPVVWSSSSAAVASINATTGLLTAVSVGSATITASVAGLSTPAQATVVVDPPQPVAVTISPATATVLATKTVTLTATVTGTTNTAVTWSADESGRVSVTGGLVTGHFAGTATVTATSVADPTKQATATITVTPKPTTWTGTIPAFTIGEFADRYGCKFSHEFTNGTMRLNAGSLALFSAEITRTATVSGIDQVIGGECSMRDDSFKEVKTLVETTYASLTTPRNAPFDVKRSGFGLRGFLDMDINWKGQVPELGSFTVELSITTYAMMFDGTRKEGPSTTVTVVMTPQVP